MKLSTLLNESVLKPDILKRLNVKTGEEALYKASVNGLYRLAIKLIKTGRVRFTNHRGDKVSPYDFLLQVKGNMRIGFDKDGYDELEKMLLDMDDILHENVLKPFDTEKASTEQLLQRMEVKSLGEALFKAVSNDNIELAEKLINKGAKLKKGLIYWAARNKNKEMVKLLIKAGANVNETNSLLPKPLVNPRLTAPIFLASIFGDTEMAKILIKAGANVNFKSEHTAITPLGKAVARIHLGVVRVLLKAGADAKVKYAYSGRELSLVKVVGIMRVGRKCGKWRKWKEKIKELLIQHGAEG